MIDPTYTLVERVSNTKNKFFDDNNTAYISERDVVREILDLEDELYFMEEEIALDHCRQLFEQRILYEEQNQEYGDQSELFIEKMEQGIDAVDLAKERLHARTDQ